MATRAFGLRVHSVASLGEFVGFPGDPPDLVERVRSLWESGRSRARWAFLLDHEGDRVGRIGLRTELTSSQPGTLGSLPPEELLAYGLSIPDRPDAARLASFLLRHALESTAGQVPELLQVKLNAEVHLHPRATCDALLACGMSLFEEKQGYSWAEASSPVKVPDRLAFRSITEVGRSVFGDLMAACGEGTLSRNDRYYWEGAGAAGWAREMMEMVQIEDAPMWLVAYEGDRPIGYVAVGRSADWGSTIHHIGVVPDRRGRGYGEDLVRAGTAAAQHAGIPTMLSDVDVQNLPMRRAMLKAGHRDDVRPWHVWALRGTLADLA